MIGATPTGVEIGLNAGGIGQLGISTDYGGGIVVAIFGQKIVWGREGGKIYYNFGGLEVIVEARNCVVVETRKILGQVVDSHVYPDPGCKLPPEPSEPSAPTLSPTDFSSDGTDMLGTGLAYVAVCSQVVGEITYFYGKQTSLVTVEINGLENKRLPDGSIDISGVSYTDTTEVQTTDTREGRSGFAKRIVSRHDPFASFNFQAGIRWLSSASSFSRQGESSYTATPQNYSYGDVGGEYGYLFYGSQESLKAWIKTFNSSAGSNYDQYGTKTTRRIKVCETVPVIPPSGKTVPVIPPSAGNQPSMSDSCCESMSADIADLMEVLAVKEILAKKMTFPWAWRMPGGQGEEILMDYPSLMRAIAQQIDHLGIHPPKLSIKDINNAIAGDQSITNQFPSVTQAFEALMAQVWDANADVDTLTNFLYRLAWLNVQQSFNMAQLTGSVESLKDMIGGETEPLETEITTPFNIEAGVAPQKPKSGKGFGKPGNNGKGGKGAAIDNRIDANTEISTEAMLPEFLKIRNNPILVDTFSGKQDIFDLLLLIRADLEKLKNK
ncbi:MULTISPECIES: hypothetical protein [unclassified Microcoleus]|uniref:hypothetical protein n=1 Tax=unclassified Microcoleus TaxID=2642155 RepID=UPI002FD5FEAF